MSHTYLSIMLHPTDYFGTVRMLKTKGLDQTSMSSFVTILFLALIIDYRHRAGTHTYMNMQVKARLYSFVLVWIALVQVHRVYVLKCQKRTLSYFNTFYLIVGTYRSPRDVWPDSRASNARVELFVFEYLLPVHGA